MKVPRTEKRHIHPKHPNNPGPSNGIAPTCEMDKISVHDTVNPTSQPPALEMAVEKQLILETPAGSDTEDKGTDQTVELEPTLTAHTTPEKQNGTASGFLSPLASLPSRKRNIIYASSDRLMHLSKLDEIADFDTGFTFEIRDPVQPSRIVSIKGKRKQVLSLVFYDGSNRSFEASVWDKRVNGVYNLLSSIELPACIYISHGKVHAPSNKHVPKTTIKHLQFTVDNQAVVDLSTLKPASPSKSTAKRKFLPCDCPSKCDKSCRVVAKAEPWTFLDLAKDLSDDGEIKTFRGLHVRICGMPKLNGNTLVCSVSDGLFLARYEGQNPKFDIGDGSCLELDVFDALFFYHAPGKMTLKIVPHETRPIKPSDVSISDEHLNFIGPSDRLG